MYVDDMRVHGWSSQLVKMEIQKDLDALVNWADTWQSRFNVGICKTLHLGKNNEQCCYKMRKHGSSDRVSFEKNRK